jgi:predicted permease
MLRQARADGVVITIGSVYGNIAMLGIPLTLSALGNQAAGPMALILSVNTPLLWLCGTLQMAWTERKLAGSAASLVRPILSDLRPQSDHARDRLRLSLALHRTRPACIPIADKTVELLAQAGSPTALIALGINLFRFEIKGQTLGMAVMCALKLLAMPAFAWMFSFHLLDLPPMAAGVVVLFAAMPAGANVYIFAAQYGRLANSVSGAVAIGTILAAATLPAIVSLLTATPR